MKLFRVSTEDWSYDCHDSFICVAEDEESARKMMPDPNYYERREDGIYFKYFDGSSERCSEGFRPWPEDLDKIEVEEIDISSFKAPAVLLASYNAG